MVQKSRTISWKNVQLMHKIPWKNVQKRGVGMTIEEYESLFSARDAICDYCEADECDKCILLSILSTVLSDQWYGLRVPMLPSVFNSRYAVGVSIFSLLNLLAIWNEPYPLIERVQIFFCLIAGRRISITWYNTAGLTFTKMIARENREYKASYWFMCLNVL